MALDSVALLGVTALLAGLIAVIVYVLLRFRASARAARGEVHSPAMDATLMADAVQEAVARLRDQGRELQARAEASERLSDQIVSSMTSGLLLVDAGGQVRVVNPAGRRLLGLGVDVIGDYRTILAGVPELREVIEQALSDGRPRARRTICRDDGTGRLTRLGLTVSPVENAEGRLQSVIGLFSDLTAVLALEEQLRLKDSLARLGELTAGIAHEFRNGLATIHGYAHLMGPDLLPPAFVPYLQGIRDETDALRGVVTNFLNFARPIPLAVASIDLGLLVSRVAEEVRPDVERDGGRLEVAGTFPAIEGDEVLIRQALSNLCRNASEACRSVSRPAVISMTGHVRAERLCRLVVTDNGPGIDPAVLDRIFQPFFTTRSNGTGLGLALVQKIIVTHNGSIAASNMPEGGACFEIELPLTQTAASA